MGKELAVREYQPFELTEKQVTMIAHTSFVPASKRGKIPEIWASIFAGRAMGIDDMSSINKIHVIEGSPAPSAHLASAVVRRRGHSLQVLLNADGTEATAVGVRVDTGDKGRETFTLEDAERAGLLNKSNWKKYPKAMLKARATTALCNSLFSDCFMGGVYTPDELGADFADPDDVIDVTAEEDPPKLFVSRHTSGGAPGEYGYIEPIPDEADSGLVEPEPTHAPTTIGAEEGGDDTAGSGSASPLDLLIHTYGRDVVAAAYREEFPRGQPTGRPGVTAPLTEDEIDRLADRLNTPIEA